MRAFRTITLLATSLLLLPAAAWGDDLPANRGPASGGTATGDPAKGGLGVSGADALIQSLLLATLPRQYENTKNWGHTERRWDGLHVSLDGLRLKTKRRWKDVNHGTWTRYQATLIDPEHQLSIRSNGLRESSDRRAAFDLVVTAKLHLTGRISEWVQGVQLYSFSAEADATVRLSMTCEAGLEFDSSQFPPDVVLSPRVTAAQLDLLDFNLYRISEVDGPVIRKLGDGLRDVLQDEINDRRQQLVAKINRTLNKHADRLRLSLPDLSRLKVASP